LLNSPGGRRAIITKMMARRAQLRLAGVNVIP
jgi:hypothetical protein